MTKNKRVTKRIGCCLLAGVVAASTVMPFSPSMEANAFSTITVDRGNIVVSRPYFLGLQDLYEWCSFIDKKINKTPDSVYNHAVYDATLLYSNTLIATDKNGNDWYGDCVIFTFGGPHNIHGNTGNMPVFVNVRCEKNPTGVTEGTMPKGADVEYNGKTIFAPAVEIGTNALGTTAIKKLYVPETYKLIADAAFKERDTLEKVTFLNEDGKTENHGSNLREIGDESFAGCSSLKDAIVPIQLLEIEDSRLNSNYYINEYRAMGKGVFKDCKALKNITINAEDKNIVIPASLFADCENISNINIRAKNAIICDSAFAGAGANNLKNFTLDCDAKIGSYVFSNNGALEHVIFNGQVDFEEIDSDSKYVASKAVFYKSFLHKSDKDTAVEFNGNVEVKLPESCFSSTGYLNKIVYGNKVEQIEVGAYAFENTGITDLKFTGKNVSINENGLAGLANTKSVAFENTNRTSFCANAFGKTDAQKTITSAVSKLSINSKIVSLCSFETIQKGASLVLGNNVLKFSWGNENNGCKIGGISNVYVTNKDTELYGYECIPNEEYNFYGYAGTRYQEYIVNSANKVSWNSYIRELQAWNAQDLGDTPTMVKSTGFDPTKIKVVAQLADKTEKVLSYSEDGTADGYTLDEDSKKKIEEALKSEGNSRVSVAINYCGATLTKSILFVPKEVESFTLASKENVSFVEGMQVDASQFTIADVKYNDGTTESTVDSKEVSVRLKSGQTKLASGTNTVIVSYKGMEKQIEVVASAKKIAKIHAALKSQDKKYYPGDTVTKDDVTVTVTYDNGEVVSDYKEFTISNNHIPYKAVDTVAVDISAGEITDTVFVAPIKVACLSANYLGTGVTEGNEINKKDISVSILYSDGTAKVLADEEYNLIYSPVVAGVENVVTVVWKEDTTKTGCFKVIGQKATGTISPTPTGTSEPAPVTPVPTASVPTPVPEPTISVNPVPTATESNAPLETPGQTVIPKEDTTIPNGDVTKLQESKLTMGVKEKVTIKLKGGTITSAVSSNKKVATVNAKGVVTAVKVGIAKVTIVDNFGKSKVVTIVVKKAPKTLKANVTKKTLKLGKKFTIKPKFAKDCYSYQIKFSTSNKKVATVNSKGVVVAKKKGKATILLKTYNGKKAKIVVVVK